MTTQRNTFSKNERLCSRKTIQQLFDEGTSFTRYPLRVTILPITDEDAVPLQVLISVSKRKFKRANKRNWIKRRIREAYRLNKHEAIQVLSENNIKLAVSFVYIPNEILDYSIIEKNVKKALKQVVSKVIPDDNH